MKGNYIITCSIERASGWQQWEVKASNKADAIRRFKAGEAVFLDESVEVTSLSEPDAELERGEKQ